MYIQVLMVSTAVTLPPGHSGLAITGHHVSCCWLPLHTPSGWCLILEACLHFGQDVGSLFWIPELCTLMVLQLGHGSGAI
jgi:hypothetical protein